MIQKSFQNNKATLYVVSTPIGNLLDITKRAIEILNTVDCIFAEDTRNSRVLLNHYNINKPLYSYHIYNENHADNKILEFLKDNKNVALISDAGTPGISDPGYHIINEVISNEYNVVAIPGASAILAALISSGLTMQPFTFIGFLPRKIGEQKKALENYVLRPETLIIYESPLRIKKLLPVLFNVLGDRKIALARELTKKFEEITRTTLKEAINLEIDERGEYVLVIDGDSSSIDYSSLSIKEHMKKYLDMNYSESDSMKMVAQDRKVSKKEIYKIIKIDK